MHSGGLLEKYKNKVTDLYKNNYKLEAIHAYNVSGFLFF